MSNPKHGTYAVRHELAPREDGSRRLYRRYGIASATDAKTALAEVRALLALGEREQERGDGQAVLAISNAIEAAMQSRTALPDYDETRRRLRAGEELKAETTVGEWLDSWLAGRKHLTRSSRTRYEVDVRIHLKPHIGHLELYRLRVSHLDAMFDAINERNIEIQEQNAQRRAAVGELKATPNRGPENRARRRELRAQISEMPPFRRVTSLNTQPKIRATLRAALNVAISQQFIPPFNAAEHVQLVKGSKSKALIWTDERVAHWEKTGERPSPVMVWTPEQTAAFLDFVAEDRLYALWRLAAYRGPRRGEICGASWSGFSATRKSLVITTQIVQDGWETYEDTPKTESGKREIALDAETCRAFEAHRVLQAKEKLAWGPKWRDTGRVFTQEDGSIIHPSSLSDLFERLVSAADLPPIRFHDLRHVAATLMLAAGIDVKVVSETLGHSNTNITRDIYQSVLTDLNHDAAEAVVGLVPHQRPRVGSTKDPAQRKMPRLRQPPRSATGS